MFRVCSLFTPLAFASVFCAEPVAMTTREFKLDFDLRAMSRSLAASQPAADPLADGSDPSSATANDPFSPNSQPGLPLKPPPLLTSQNVLSQMGISFPPGATAFYDSCTRTLRVHNTPEMLHLIQVLADSAGESFPRDVVYSLTVIEGPGEIIRRINETAAHKADAGAELGSLLAQAQQPGSKARVISDDWMQIQSGTRATSTSAQERIHTLGLSFDARSHAILKREMRPLGMQLEIEPLIHSGDTALKTTLDSTLRLQLTLAPPQLRPVSITDPGTGNAAEYSTTSFSQAEFATTISSANGSTKLIGVTAPRGQAEAPQDLLWAVFLTTTIHAQEPVPVAPLQSPPIPKNTPKGLQAASLRVPDGVFVNEWGEPAEPLQKWLEAKGIPAIQGASAAQQDGVLHLINTPDNIERIVMLVDEALEAAPKSIACTLHTVQAPADFLRHLAHASAAASDHAGMWAQVEAAVARGEGRFINSAFIESPSAVRAKHSSSSELLFVEEFGLDAKGRSIPGIAYRDVGSVFEIEPELRGDGRTLDVILSGMLHPAPPAMRRETFRDPASGLRFDLPVPDFHATQTTTKLVMTAGGTRLLSLHPPTGRDAEGMLWATFLKCDVVTQVKPRKSSPRIASPTRPLDPKSWHTQSYKAPPDFLSSANVEGKKKPTAQSVLEAAGIPFPKGATAIFDPAHALLIVHSTQENLDLVEAYVTGLDDSRSPSTVAYTAQIFQGPGPLLRQLTAQAAGKCDQRAELDALLAAVKSGTVQALDTARIETRFGPQATTTQAREHTSLSTVKVNDKGETEFDQDIRQVGLTLSIEPKRQADNRAIESTLSLEFHTSEPKEHREQIIDSQDHKLELPLTDYQVIHLSTGPTMPSGTAHLAGLWKPVGKPEFEEKDILQMLFITCDHLWVEP